MKNKSKISVISIVIAIIAAISVIFVGVSFGNNTEKEDTTVESSGFVVSGTQNKNENNKIPGLDKNESDEEAGQENVVSNNNLPGKEAQNNSIDNTKGSDAVVDEIKGINKNYKVNLKTIPRFSGKAYWVVNDNIPGLKADDLNEKYFEKYSALDSLGRCGVAYACLGKETMPTEERGEIGQVKPSGWKTVKYDCVDGKYLYNRCHLIGFQLSGENANNRNLITGTRFMNVQGMLPFENMVADYIKETGNHVLYRVTPVFKDSELVARGVQIEAYSVEDNGEGICFNVYCYNNQPGVIIDYDTGNSVLDEGEKNTTEKNGGPSEQATYILNTNSRKIHRSSCSSAKSINEKNKKEYTGSKEELIEKGYTPCGACKP